MLLVLVIVEFVFFHFLIIDLVFQVLMKVFFRKFYFMCSQISCLAECHNELRQNKCCSQVRVLVNVYCLCLVVLFFHQCFLCF